MSQTSSSTATRTTYRSCCAVLARAWRANRSVRGLIVDLSRHFRRHPRWLRDSAAACSPAYSYNNCKRNWRSKAGVCAQPRECPGLHARRHDRQQRFQRPRIAARLHTRSRTHPQRRPRHRRGVRSRPNRSPSHRREPDPLQDILATLAVILEENAEPIACTGPGRNQPLRLPARRRPHGQHIDLATPDRLGGDAGPVHRSDADGRRHPGGRRPALLVRPASRSIARRRALPAGRRPASCDRRLLGPGAGSDAGQVRRPGSPRGRSRPARRVKRPTRA